eukprot:scaffold651654_cov46-Prasinocladus_malaysianus.AAC.1
MDADQTDMCPSCAPRGAHVPSCGPGVFGVRRAPAAAVLQCAGEPRGGEVRPGPPAGQERPCPPGVRGHHGRVQPRA